MAGSDSKGIPAEDLQKLRDWFNWVDVDNNGHIAASEVGNFFKTAVGSSVPGYQIREMIRSVDKDGDGNISFSEFVTLFTDSRFATHALRQAIPGIKPDPSSPGEEPDQAPTEGHSDSDATSFASFIAKSLQDDNDAYVYMPMNPDPIDEFISKLTDGVLLCKMINKSVPNTVDERVLMKTPNLTPDTVLDNQRLALNSARSIGCNVGNIGLGADMSKPHLILGLLWQIIRVGFVANVKITQNHSLIHLRQSGETVEDLMGISAEQMLLRWVNYFMERDGNSRRISNFTDDIKDSEVYLTLLEQIDSIAPSDVSLLPRPASDQPPLKKAAVVLANAGKIDAAFFVTPKGIVKGDWKLNFAFVANLFISYPALPPFEDPDLAIPPDTREEFVFRNWMNSIGVHPFVNYLYSDLTDGLVLLQIIDKFKPGIVKWDRVNRGPSLAGTGGRMRKIENCDYVMDLTKQLRFSVVGIAGKDIFDANHTLTLAIVWQLMRGYGLRLVNDLIRATRPFEEADLLQLINQKLETSGKDGRLASFNDPSISESLVILQLVDAIRPGAVNWSRVERGNTNEEKLNRAKYALSSARKIGTKVYARQEDIVEVKPKMMVTMFLGIAAVLLDTMRTSSSS